MRNDIAKDFVEKVVKPVVAALLLFALLVPIFTNNGKTDYIMIWILAGIPFGIRRMYVWVLPRNYDLGGTVGMIAFNFIVGGIIGGFVLGWRLVCAAFFLFVTLYRLFRHDNGT